ncbi:MAG TPA: hypothetical protein VIE65_05685 [Methylobacter sp.]
MKFESILTHKPSRWPKKGDLPFHEAMRAEAAGRLAADGLTREVSIMDGFMHAGTALADLALKERLRRYDLVYPMLFCYRHAVETGLKWLITQYGPSVGVRPENISCTHDLLSLWRDLVRINEACGAKADDEALMVVEKIIKQFHDWDKGGITFRYATTTSGAVAKFEHENIDIENLKDVMSGVANFFDGSDGWLDSIANA